MADGWDWDIVGWVIFFCLLSVSFCFCGRWVAKVAIAYFKRQEFIKSRIIGLPLRRKRPGYLHSSACGLLEFVEWLLWCVATKVIHRTLRRLLVGGPRRWLWVLARVVHLPACLLHLVVGALLLATVQDGTHLTNPPIVGTAVYFFAWAGLELVLFICARWPRTSTQLTWLARACAVVLVWDAVACALLADGALLAPVIRTHCLEVGNTHLFSAYRFVRAAYVEGLGAGAVCTDAGQPCSLEVLGAAAVRASGNTTGVLMVANTTRAFVAAGAPPPELGACVLCASKSLGSALRTSAVGGIWTQFSTTAEGGGAVRQQKNNPMLHIRRAFNATAGGSPNLLSLCIALQSPTMGQLNASALAALIGCTNAHLGPACDTVAPCVDCLESATKRLPVLPLVLMSLLLLALTAAVDLRQELERVAQAPDAAVELRRLEAVQRQNMAKRKHFAGRTPETTRKLAMAAHAQQKGGQGTTTVIQVRPAAAGTRQKPKGGSLERHDFGITVGAAPHIKLALAEAYAMGAE